MNPQTQSTTWLVSAKMIVSSIASALAILSALVGVSGWCIGLYYGLATRVTVLEGNSQHMSDDLKDIKAMLSQLMMSRADSRPETRGWAK